ncbi:unnamed protein product [Urochloa decumbens]|uniref:Uncharacterized protein n=1 Tax=Urochloa decumbens TaxID=240449 RepID=A0ABC8XIT5_9POAL
MAAFTVSSWVPPLPESSAAASGLVLLDRWSYIADLPNTTTAESTTSTGLPIQVTFRAARPPLVSHFCVHCPGLDFRSIGPKIIATDADLVLLCVPVDPDSVTSGSDWDYFVYTPRAQRLNLLPNPRRTRNRKTSTTPQLPSSAAKTALGMAVAALGVRPPTELRVAYPILSMDDDVVYLLSRTSSRNMEELAVMFAIDVRKATLRGLAQLDVQKISTSPNFFTSETCRGA